MNRALAVQDVQQGTEHLDFSREVLLSLAEDQDRKPPSLKKHPQEIQTVAATGPGHLLLHEPCLSSSFLRALQFQSFLTLSAMQRGKGTNKMLHQALKK